ncbi:MAG: hypothetical protein HYZ71_04725, partial [Deltaproteobacteria bacterium]|nr:hypothetical protein [Deltaproteobacteria bacterium]
MPELRNCWRWNCPVANTNTRLLLCQKAVIATAAPVPGFGGHFMKSIPRLLTALALIICILLAVAYARELGAREARQRIAEVVGLEKADAVRIKSINTGMGGEAVVEAQFEAAFRFNKDKQGTWNAVEVRTGDRRWESIELIQTAIRKEKVLRTTADLRTLVTALEAFRRERGFYVAAGTGAVLLDNLAPRFLS